MGFTGFDMGRGLFSATGCHGKQHATEDTPHTVVVPFFFTFQLRSGRLFLPEFFLRESPRAPLSGTLLCEESRFFLPEFPGDQKVSEAEEWDGTKRNECVSSGPKSFPLVR